VAIVTRYFSTTAAGDETGSSWANRAALFDGSGNWSSVITGFNFSGSDSLKCLIGPGTYTCSQSLAAALFANAPTVANPLILHGCDGSGNALTPSNPDWVSAQPVDWDSGLPVIATTTNVITVSLVACQLRLMKFTASAVNNGVIGVNHVDWCVVENSHNGTAARAFYAGSSIGLMNLANSAFHCSGASYAAVVEADTNGPYGLRNIRISGITGSGGNRAGLDINAFSPSLHMDRCTVMGVGGVGILVTGQAAADMISRSTVVACGSDGINLARSTAGTKATLNGLMVSGNGGYGVNASNTTGLFVSNSRLRDNTSGNLNGLGNYPTDLDNYTTDSDDATEYVDAANGDYRIKAGCAIWGKGYGAGDEVAGVGGVDLPEPMVIGA
jgi:hypothetical protein